AESATLLATPSRPLYHSAEPTSRRPRRRTAVSPLAAPEGVRYNAGAHDQRRSPRRRGQPRLSGLRQRRGHPDKPAPPDEEAASRRTRRASPRAAEPRGGEARPAAVQ